MSASVVSSREAIDDEFCSAERTTFAGYIDRVIARYPPAVVSVTG